MLETFLAKDLGIGSPMSFRIGPRIVEGKVQFSKSLNSLSIISFGSSG